MDPVVHFELPFDDNKRIAEFYKNAFGWKTTQLGPEMFDYILATTTEADEKGWPKKVGQINGGFYGKKGLPKEHPTVVIGVSDIQETMKKITAAGGRVLSEPTEIPGYGTYVTFLDTEGNRISAIQPPPGM